MSKTKNDFVAFQKRVEETIMSHSIIHKNEFTEWFKNGDLSVDEVKHFLVQFSVFSNLFLVAQLKKVINSASLNEMRQSKEILLNELGVVFNKRKTETDAQKKQRQDDSENEGDPKYVNTEGTIEGGVFRFKAAHFEWLLDIGKAFDLKFDDLGKRCHGTESTLHFTDGLERIYGHSNFNVASGASFAIENWAAAGFWKELIQGLKTFREQKDMKFPIAFFSWHDKVEDQHAEHTQEELEEIFYYNDFNEEEFIKAGLEMLDCCEVFWKGLNQDRKNS